MWASAGTLFRTLLTNHAYRKVASRPKAAYNKRDMLVKRPQAVQENRTMLYDKRGGEADRGP